MYPPPPTMIVGNPKLLTNLAQFPCPADVEARVSGNAGSGGTRLTMHGQVETTQLVTRERIGPTLKDDGGRAVPIHDMLNHLRLGFSKARVKREGDVRVQRCSERKHR